MAGKMNSSHWHIAKCAECGIGVLTRQNGGHDILCKEHKHARRFEYNRQYNKIRKTKHGEKSFTVIRDPDPIGGYSCGATFTITDHECNLENNNYTPGTLMKTARGGMYIVVDTGGKQELRLCRSG
jgi:hypothetical protein